MGGRASGVVGVALSAPALVLLLTGLASALAVDPDLVGHWRLDGNANDSAGGHHGTLVGGATWAADPQRGWCLDLDGSGSYVDVGDDPALTFSDAITVACWIKARGLRPQLDRSSPKETTGSWPGRGTITASRFSAWA